MKWSKEFTVNSHDTDCNGVVRASAVLRYMQEAANLQLSDNVPSMDDLRKDGKVFILSKLNMSIYRPLHAYEKITVMTWPCPGKGASFIRCSRIFRDGVIIAELVSVWALVDINTKKLYRNNDIELNLDLHEMLDLDVPPRIQIPEELPLSLVGERTVYYSDIDLNMHMNNTNYPDMFCDFLPKMKGFTVIRCAINYIHEAPLGETLKIYCGEDDGSYYFRTVKEDGSVGTTAEIVLEELK